MAPASICWRRVNSRLLLGLVVGGRKTPVIVEDNQQHGEGRVTGTFIDRQLSRGIRAAMPTLSYLFEQRTLQERLRYQNLFRTLSPNARRSEADALAHIQSFEPSFDMSTDAGFGSIGLDPELTQQCIDDTRRRLASVKPGQQKNAKEYARTFTGLSDYDVDAPPFHLATSPGVVSAVSRYLDGAPVLWGISAIHSPPGSAIKAASLNGSQYWHRDGDDTSNVKLWVLCSDVEPENGPTVCLPRKLSDRIATDIGYKQGEKVLDDKVFEPYTSDMFSLTGKSGDVFATDTSRCFHMGSRTSQDHGRLVLMLHYVSRYAIYFWPAFSSVAKRKAPQMRGLNRLQKDLLFPF